MKHIPQQDNTNMDEMTDITATYGINDAFFDFIDKHSTCDTAKLLLSKSNNATDFDLKFAVMQIHCRQRITKKLPQIVRLKHFLFPSALATEQCTCQVVAQFHSTLFEGMHSVADLTAGLGIDDYYIAQQVKTLTSVEITQLLATTLRHNMGLYRPNVTVVNADASTWLGQAIANGLRFDAVFIDPARRGENDRRIYSLTDCQPNVLQLLDPIKHITDTLFIKASPMYDVAQCISEVPGITHIWIVAVNNECKELLLRTSLDANSNLEKKVTINTLNFENEDSPQSLTLSIPRSNTPPIKYCDRILTFLYEPNCCIMKAQAFNELTAIYDQLLKLSVNTHLFTADTAYTDFPGRSFKVIETIPFKSSCIKQVRAKYPKANISTRNFRLSAQELKKKLKIDDGGDIYIFATTSGSDNLLVITKKLQ